nr:hypothetical protein [Akkermansiaceae bacterium]
EISAQTAAAIAERHPGTRVAVLDVPPEDPTNHPGSHQRVAVKVIDPRGNEVMWTCWAGRW